MTTRDPAGVERRRLFAEEARAERPDLARLCLLLGAEEPGPGRDGSGPDPYGIDAAEIELDRLAGELPYGTRSPGDWAAALADLLGGRYGFGGAAPEYRRLESSLLQEVLRRRRGLPILLSVVWMEVARRAGAPVHGVALPGHFVVAFGDAHDRVLADPFAGGVTLSGQDARALVAGATGSWPSGTERAWEPARPLEVVSRVLTNIRVWAEARPERSDVSLWALDLSLLLPSHPARLRFERARVLVRRGDYLAGARAMEEYADVVAGVEPASAELIRGEARAARSLLN
ncbi:transglutaminase-like domain-containing protein [uncultured Streptomyces sp.]|uniref:transglutaminase-like domain-containing protein n=1 Tax=uncultured Streptomyces sp. TaxID=174707 RepID=UPI00260538A1|nr:transglutaminase-like domain-containing protein [uncultured Streptomyces sp.]